MEISIKAPIFQNLDKFVRDEIANKNVPDDAKYVIVATADNKIGKVLAAVNIKRTDKISLELGAMWKHEWETKNDSVQAQLVFIGR